MIQDSVAQIIVALAGGSLEISRENLEIAKTILIINQENLRINTLTLEATLQKIEVEKQLLVEIKKLNNKL